MRMMEGEKQAKVHCLYYLSELWNIAGQKGVGHHNKKAEGDKYI